MTFPDDTEEPRGDPAFGGAPGSSLDLWVQALSVPSATGVLVGGAVRYYGFALRETTGTAAARVKVWSGSNNAAELLDVIQLAPNESAREWYGPGGIAANGLYFELVTGAVEGAIRVLVSLRG